MRLFLSVVVLSIAMFGTPAFAQFAPAPVGTTVDLAPIVNVVIQIAAALLVGLALPLTFALVGKAFKSWGIDAAAELAATRVVVDSVAQKAIGGAIAKYSVKPGQITIDVKSEIIADAASTLVKNASESLGKLGVPENEQIIKAREMIAARIGLMDAAAAGKPVPDPAQPAAAVQPVPIVLKEAASRR